MMEIDYRNLQLFRKELEELRQSIQARANRPNISLEYKRALELADRYAQALQIELGSIQRRFL